MKNRKWTLAIFTGLSIFWYQTHAQSTEDILKLFPGEKEVFLNKILEYKIEIQNGQPKVESHALEQVKYLQANGGQYMGAFGFYHSGFQQLLGYEAYTKTANDKKIKVNDFKTSSDKESFVFYDDVKRTTFNFPSVETGAVGNLEVSWLNSDPHLLTPFYFSSHVPVLNSQLKISVSKDISFKYILEGIDTNKIEVTVENKRHQILYSFQYKNCPAEQEYADAPDFPWYSPHVIFYIDKYKDSTGNWVNYLSSLRDLYKLSYGYLKGINEMISPELKRIVDSLTLNITTAKEKARKIYSWVQTNIKYVAFENGMEGFVPRDASLVCSRRYGDCKDMASILTQMLNYIHIPAYFTWIGTRDLPYKFSQLPLPLVSNHMICTILLDGKYIFLDGTDPTCVFGKPPYGIQDKEALLSINENEYKILKVPIINMDENVMSDSTWLEIDNDSLIGKIKRDLKGYFAASIYGELLYSNDKKIKDEMKAILERGSNKFILDSFSIEKGGSPDHIVLTGIFNLPNYAKRIGNEYYLNLNLFKLYVDQEIDIPHRNMPISYNFKSQKKYVTMLKLPEGYHLGDMPAGRDYSNLVWGFQMKYQQKGNWVILTQEFDNNHLFLEKNEFEPWNKVLENLYPLYKESLNIIKN